MVRWVGRSVGRFQLYQTSAATTDQFQVDDLWEYYEEEEEDGIDWWWPEEGSSWSVWIEEVGLRTEQSEQQLWMNGMATIGWVVVN